ncbi:hypothetical protein CEXT_346561 [Caerostris extrusa]|uniref:Uncharacterized protein n=1 Tax=Caerostris extrusa TaxID=172846 RepID=A0AAV4P3T2_CAEEX|nr:hypothetical protein CEXT_346561 [Caerostris extrusa]
MIHHPTFIQELLSIKPPSTLCHRVWSPHTRTFVLFPFKLTHSHSRTQSAPEKPPIPIPTPPRNTLAEHSITPLGNLFQSSGPNAQREISVF